MMSEDVVYGPFDRYTEVEIPGKGDFGIPKGETIVLTEDGKLYRQKAEDVEPEAFEEPDPENENEELGETADDDEE